MTPPPTERRLSFDDVADDYVVARPAYPEQLIDDLIAAKSLNSASRVLEIGCGPGTLTLPLAKSGASIIALELGANLARVATTRLAGCPNVRVQQTDFDLWSLPRSSFDVVVVATAFHWLDAATRVRRCRAALKPKGILAVIDTHWGVGADVSPFSLAVQPCYARWDPHHRPDFIPDTLADLPLEHEEIQTSRLFESVDLHRYTVSRTYDADQFCGLLNTYSDVRSFGTIAREGFLRCVRELIESDFGGEIARSDSYSLWIARAGSG